MTKQRDLKCAKIYLAIRILHDFMMLYSEPAWHIDELIIIHITLASFITGAKTIDNPNASCVYSCNENDILII